MINEMLVHFCSIIILFSFGFSYIVSLYKLNRAELECQKCDITQLLNLIYWLSTFVHSTYLELKR